ncbi:MAG: hypothetical protein U1F11_04725 [Steroidobacteraceae bacterium]
MAAARGAGRIGVQLVGAREQRQQVHDVVLGLVPHAQVLVIERTVERILKNSCGSRLRDHLCASPASSASSCSSSRGPSDLTMRAHAARFP